MTSTSLPSNCTTATETCTKDGTPYYSTTCATCADGYEIDANGACQVSCALTSTSLPSNCATATESCVKNGITYYSTTCKTCKTKYTLVSGKCRSDYNCNGWNSSLSGNQTSYNTCTGETTGTTYYKETACQMGYNLPNSYCSYTFCDCSYLGYGAERRTSTPYTDEECISLGYREAGSCIVGSTAYYVCWEGPSCNGDF